MNLKNQKKLSAQLLKVGINRVWFDTDRLEEIKEAITKADLKGLISSKVIQAKPMHGISKFRTRKNKLQKRKGNRKGAGSRKGKKTSRLGRKEAWVSSVRTQRNFIKLLKSKEVVTKKVYRDIYNKVKGGYFRSRRHIKLFLTEHNLFKKK
ncbi:50S ribosomal protein L19e [archaeon]|nr:50S ribosomal protein L19e [archaeon]|tara:strand:+ start:3158 stop:3610 length:453 start_codon:yes stop_codon:yes gene_type:complete